MKKLLFLLVALFALAAFANAQRVYTLPNDTLTDAETVYTTAIESSSSRGTVTLQAVFTQLTGTTAITAYPQGSVDGTSFVDITNVADMFTAFPSDTVTVTDGVVAHLIIKSSPYKSYRWKLVGTGTQSTKIEQSYVPKLK